MIIFDKTYRNVIIKRLPVMYYYASAKNIEKKNSTVTITYKTKKDSALKQIQTFPFYKPVSKINL